MSKPKVTTMFVVVVQWEPQDIITAPETTMRDAFTVLDGQLQLIKSEIQSNLESVGHRVLNIITLEHGIS